MNNKMQQMKMIQIRLLSGDLLEQEPNSWHLYTSGLKWLYTSFGDDSKSPTTSGWHSWHLLALLDRANNLSGYKSLL